MVTVIASHEVKNFEEWKTGFDNDETARMNAGLKTMGVFRSMENPNHVTMMFEAPSAEVFSGMMSSPELQEKMKNAGVITVPEMKMFTKA